MSLAKLSVCEKLAVRRVTELSISGLNGFGATSLCHGLLNRYARRPRMGGAFQQRRDSSFEAFPQTNADLERLAPTERPRVAVEPKVDRKLAHLPPSRTTRKPNASSSISRRAADRVVQACRVRKDLPLLRETPWRGRDTIPRDSKGCIGPSPARVRQCGSNFDRQYDLVLPVGL